MRALLLTLLLSVTTTSFAGTSSCGDMQQIKKVIDTSLPTQADEVTTTYGFLVNCDTNTMTYQQTINLPNLERLAVDKDIRTVVLSNIKNRMCTLSIDSNWTVVYAWYTVNKKLVTNFIINPTICKG